MIVVAVDPSSSATGIAAFRDGRYLFSAACVISKRPASGPWWFQLAEWLATTNSRIFAMRKPGERIVIVMEIYGDWLVKPRRPGKGRNAAAVNIPWAWVDSMGMCRMALSNLLEVPADLKETPADWLSGRIYAGDSAEAARLRKAAASEYCGHFIGQVDEATAVLLVEYYLSNLFAVDAATRAHAKAARLSRKRAAREAARLAEGHSVSTPTVAKSHPAQPVAAHQPTRPGRRLRIPAGVLPESQAGGPR